MIKAIFVDIDGTLRDSNRNLSVKTIETIKRVSEKGILVILCSGRPRKYTEQIVKDKINKRNIDLAISEFEDFCKPRDGWKAMEKDFSQWNGSYVTEIYEMLKKLKNNIDEE